MNQGDSAVPGHGKISRWLPLLLGLIALSLYLGSIIYHALV